VLRTPRLHLGWRDWGRDVVRAHRREAFHFWLAHRHHLTRITAAGYLHDITDAISLARSRIPSMSIARIDGASTASARRSASSMNHLSLPTTIISSRSAVRPTALA